MIDKGSFFEINIALGECSYFFKQRKYSDNFFFFLALRPKFKVESSVYLLPNVVSTLLCFECNHYWRQALCS